MKLIILDRDGVINVDSDDFIKSPSEWAPIPGSLEAIARLKRAQYQVVVATNQSGVARGLFDMDMLNTIHMKMIQGIRQRGAELDGIFFCPHGPDDGCDCRKPKAGLFEQIADRLKVNLNGVYAVGDSERDVLAAKKAGAQPVLVLTGKGKKTLKSSSHIADVPVYNNLAEFTDALLNQEIN
jgi:D-glycero-D-manno-heptose 1,7-bisphosphate phosphatase